MKKTETTKLKEMKKEKFDPFKSGKPDSRFMRPKKSPHCKFLKYSNAQKLVEDIGYIEENERVAIVVDGTFYLGDFIEAFIVDNDLAVKNMIVSTLSLSRGNVDSFKNLIENGYIKGDMTLIVSDFFYSHNKKAVPYIYEELGVLDNFQFVVVSCHTKITLIELVDGTKFVIHGSGNLVSSNNIENLFIERQSDLHDFYADLFSQLTEKYKTINKSVRNADIRNIPFFADDNYIENKFN